MNAEVQKLKQILQECQSHLKKIGLEIKKLRNNSQLLETEKELKDCQTKLTTCQQEKETIQTELDNKLEELKSSQLSNEEKAQQMINLLTDSKKELDLLTKQLEQAWITYARAKDKMLEYLTHPCSACACKSKSIKELAKVRNGLFWVVIILLCLLLFALWPTKKKKSK